ncbi:MAG: cyanate hydratase [Neisseriaceae bacterium]|nr:cyanate hydratase [Neisseriaceae bacterium]MBQ9620055.1 cyanate hydratase [Neisseriaceae bacterium]
MKTGEKQNPLPPRNSKEALKQWQDFSHAHGFANEWTVAARLGKQSFTEEEAHWVSHMFGR